MIEKFDSRRYKYLLWQTILFGSAFPVITLSDYIEVWIPVLLLACVAMLVFIWLAVRGVAIGRQIRALNDELVVLYGYKSLTWAFCATLTIAFVFWMLSGILPRITGWQIGITVRLVCCTIIYVALMANWIAQLIYRRR